MIPDIAFAKTHPIVSVTPLLKGWSGDKKTILQAEDGSKYLLRLSDISMRDQKKAQFDRLKPLENMNLYCSRPIEWGTIGNESVYMLLTYLEGTDATEAVSRMEEKEAYLLGMEAGRTLRRLHQIAVPAQPLSWWARYQEKASRKIAALLRCGRRLPMQEELIAYYEDHLYLMKDRPLVFTHGDYHLGNMVVRDGHIGIIDFDKSNFSDPYDEFKPFCWNVVCSAHFETGLINGYFDNRVPDDFFPILKFYTAESLISHLPWAITFGPEEVRTAQEIASHQMRWYDHFTREIPTWYQGVLPL